MRSNSIIRSVIGLLVTASAIATTGCTSRYMTPGPAASFRAMGITPEEVEAQTDVSIARRLERKPLARFPASIAVVRVQGTGYRSHTSRGFGDGQFTIVTGRDVEPRDSFAQLANLPMIADVQPLNQLVMPRQLRGEEDLRGAAASVQADMLLLYTFDTQFETNTKVKPLGLITLGLFPDREANVTCTASAALLDTRNGYVYGLSEATARESKLSNAWNSEDAIDTSRRRTEQAAFVALMDDVGSMWQRVTSRYAAHAQ